MEILKSEAPHPEQPDIYRLLPESTRMNTHIDSAVIPARPILLDRSKSTAQYFEDGNYTTAAMLGRDDEWQKWAAMCLIGLPERGLSGLLEFGDAEHLRFYQAVACFMMRADEQAVQLLETVQTEHAYNLLKLLRKPQITVLTQLPWSQQPATYLKHFMPLDRRFRLQSIGREEGDLSEMPYMNILDYVSDEAPPDFYLAMMVEFHYLPTNLQALGCPVIGHTADFDIHYHCVRPWLKCFDELVVNDGTEWQHLSALTDRGVTTMPKSFGLMTSLEPIPSGPRPIDVAQTGTLFHPYHYDKARYVIALLKSKATNGYYINRFPPPEHYQKLLGRSKLTLVYARHGGCMPTRGIEALAMGCIPLVHRDNCLQLFAGEAEGLVTYDYEAEDITAKVEQVVQGWDSVYAARARRGARAIREQFSMPMVASQYLRYMTVLAARPRKKERGEMPHPVVQKRPIIYKGWVPDPDRMRHQHMATLQRLAALQSTDQDGTTYNLWLRETAFAMMIRDFKLGDAQLQGDALSHVQDSCFQVLSRFPKALVLRFNLVRVGIFQGHPRDVTRSLRLTDQMLREPLEYWLVRPEDDVLAWDYAAESFNYRAYLDNVSRIDCGQASAQEALVQLIYASLYHLRGIYTGDLEDHRNAQRLDPDFPHYALAYAREVCQTRQVDAFPDVIPLLEMLADTSIVALEAVKLLQESTQISPETRQRVAQLHARYSAEGRTLTAGNAFTPFEPRRCLYQRTPA